MAEIFVSYRNKDTGDFAGRLADRLRHDFGKQSVFLASDTIVGGQHWEQVLEEELARCRVLLAIIGEHWLDGSGEADPPLPSAWVQREIDTAFRRRISIIPVLVDVAALPATLPDELGKLHGIQCYPILRAHFDWAADSLVELLDKKYLPMTTKKWLLAGVRLLLVALGLVLLVPETLSVTKLVPPSAALGLAAILGLSPNRRRRR